MVGVGCMIDSCRHCEPCEAGDQNYCEGPNSWLATYNGPMVPAKMVPTGEDSYGRDNTYGGYSDVIVVPEDFVLSIPPGLRPEVAAPILRAGVTTFSPLPHWNVKAGGLIIGSIALDFCAEHGIGPDIEIIAIQDINDGYKKVLNGDVRFRYVIDMASLRLEEAA